MNRLPKLTASLLALTVSWGQTAVAQDETNAVPVEFFACNYAEGKGLTDLQKVGKAFSKWSKKNNGDYAAWILTPQFHDATLGFDVGWLGAWGSGNAFGAGQDMWMSKGGDLAQDFAEVMDCSLGHQMASSVVISAPDGPPGDGIVMFSECRLKDGKNLADSYNAHKKTGAAMKALGSKTSSWLFYPSLGAGDIDFQYWSVIAANNYTELGAAWEMFTNGGGWQKSQENLGKIVACGSPSVFDAHVVVAGNPRQ